MYQMMDQGFVGLIFSCFIEDKNTKVGNLKIAINPPSTHGKHQPQDKAEILGCSKKGWALLGAQSKRGWNGDVWIVIPTTNEWVTDEAALSHRLALQPAELGWYWGSGAASDGCSVCVLTHACTCWHVCGRVSVLFDCSARQTELITPLASLGDAAVVWVLCLVLSGFPR